VFINLLYYLACRHVPLDVCMYVLKKHLEAVYRLLKVLKVTKNKIDFSFRITSC